MPKLLLLPLFVYFSYMCKCLVRLSSGTCLICFLILGLGNIDSLMHALIGSVLLMLRPSPPSQSVLAVSNTYGRVRKPLGFKFIGSFSGIQGCKTEDIQSDTDDDCSLWLPVAPPGYLAIGCVANIGRQPPPNHTVHCIRSDLVTSTAYSECMLNVLANHSFESGFSIWRLDNCLGSFYAHPSSGYPLKDVCFDLNHLLLWNSCQLKYSSDESLGDMNSENKRECNQTSGHTATSSGWDVLRSVSKTTSFYVSTPNFERIWWDRGGDLRRPFSVWRPIPRPGYSILGDCITEGLDFLSLSCLCNLYSLHPRTKVAHNFFTCIKKANIIQECTVS